MSNRLDERTWKAWSQHRPFWSIVAILGTLGLCWLWPAGKSSEAKTIEAVLERDKAIGNWAMLEVQRGRDRLQSVNWMAKEMLNIDTSRCPPDFREAYMRHCTAWEDMALHLKDEPTDFLDALWKGAVNHVTRGEADGGQRRLVQRHDTRSEAVKRSWDDVRAVAARHNAKVR
jgi:hypothetical protein